MADVKHFIDLDNLTLYDGLLKNVIAEEDAKALKTVSIEGTVLKFYREENPTSQTQPAYSIDIPQQDLSNYVEKVINGPNGAAKILNESDGGGIFFEHKNNLKSFVGVNDGSEGEIAAQIYAVKKVDGKSVGSRINVTTNGIYYTTGKDSPTFSSGDEIATKKDLSDGSVSKTVYLQDASAGQSDYAKVYKLYQGSDAVDMSKNTFVGAVNIPLDKVVKDGHLVTVTNGVDSDGDEVPAGITDGTYIKLTFQNVAQAVYINVHDLVDVYTGGTTAEVTINIDSNNEITATINEISGSKLADGTVTKAKLSTSVQDSLDLADSSLQDGDITSVSDQDIEGLFS